MKFSALILSALAGSALAAPSEQFTTPGGNHHYQSITKRSAGFTTPGGDHQYQAISRRSAEKTFQLSKRIGTVAIAVASVAAGGFLGFVAGPLAARAMNSVFGVQKKRNVHYDIADLTFNEARELWIEALVDSIFEVNPHNGTADAAVCAGTGYYISDPKATLSATAFQFRADGQEHEYDCFLVEGPVTIEVKNATAADFAFVAPANSAYRANILTVN